MTGSGKQHDAGLEEGFVGRFWWALAIALLGAMPQNISASSTVGGGNSLVVDEASPSLAAPASRWNSSLYVEPKTLRPNNKTLRMRIEAEKRKPEIAEPIVLRLKTSELRPLLAQLASDSTFRKINQSETASFQLMKSLETRIERKQPAQKADETVPTTVALLPLAQNDLDWLDLDKLSQALAYPSIEPFIPVEEVRALKSGDPTTVQRWSAHFSHRFEEIRNIAENWLKAQPHALQMPFQTLLPTHMRKLLGRYSPFRGRNCFATALQFADPAIIQLKNINMVKEPGHSLALINHDEFSHALWLGYDELSPQQQAQGLEFGDLVAIIDGKDSVSYTSFKHAVIHIAEDVYLHKPSKSASSPIEFVRWQELVQTWKPLVAQFDVRFFRRRPSGQLEEQTPRLAVEKIKWNR